MAEDVENSDVVEVFCVLDRVCSSVTIGEAELVVEDTSAVVVIFVVLVSPVPFVENGSCSVVVDSAGSVLKAVVSVVVTVVEGTEDVASMVGETVVVALVVNVVTVSSDAVEDVTVEDIILSVVVVSVVLVAASVNKVVSGKLVLVVDVDGLVSVVDTGSDVIIEVCAEVDSNVVATVIEEGLVVAQSSHCTHSPVASSKM